MTDRPQIVEQITPDREYTVDDFVWQGKWFITESKVMRTINYHTVPTCPPYLHQLMERYGADSLSMFASIDEYTANGMGWHSDDKDVYAVNLVGTTEWVFGTAEKEWYLLARPYDVIYVPMGIQHRVNVRTDERITVSFVCPVDQKYNLSVE